MVKRTSEELQKGITFTPDPQSPMPAGALVQVATDDVSGWEAANWLECDGSAVSRTTYADLFAVTGTKYGIGDGSTTFNLPNGPRKTFDIELAITVTPASGSWTNRIKKGWFEQTIDGEWWLNWFIAGNTSVSSANVVIAFDGCTLLFDGNTRIITSGGTSSSSTYGKGVLAGADLTLYDGSSGTVWGTEGKARLTGKPTDSSMASDSRFSTFDEALQSIPMIKAYQDYVNGSVVGINPASTTEQGIISLTSNFAATTSQYGFIKAPNGTVILEEGNGRGSANTAIRRFTNSTVSGDAFTYADSATLGASITANRDCLVGISYYDRSTTSGWANGVSINADGTIQVTDLASSVRPAFAQFDANRSGNVSCTIKVSQGDVIRPHVNIDAGLTALGREQMWIEEIMPL